MTVDSSIRSSAALADLFERPQFSIPQDEKEELLLGILSDLTRMHGEKCEPYARILNGISYQPADRISDLPYLPVSLFKTNKLSSVSQDEVFKTLTSSGTTGQAVSRITLDRHTADIQSKALRGIMAKILGNTRHPMLIIDTPNVVRNRLEFSARGAGVLGMMPFGRKHTYVLDDDMSLDLAALRDFLERFGNSTFVMFGFTFMAWKYFLQEIRKLDETIDLSNGILVHSGGWKKLADEAVWNNEFKSAFQQETGLASIHNFYGMVEQVGSVFLEGDDGWLYPSNFSDVVIRNPETWEEAEYGEPGVVEVLSVLPHSYPGHVLLTEDLGIVHGVGSPESGWSGKQLEILGRVPKAELRGCSDTHAYDGASV